MEVVQGEGGVGGGAVLEKGKGDTGEREDEGSEGRLEAGDCVCFKGEREGVREGVREGRREGSAVRQKSLSRSNKR